MIRTGLAVLTVVVVAGQAVNAQESAIYKRQTWPSASPISKIDSLLTESSPSQWLAAPQPHNPRYTPTVPAITVGAGRTLQTAPTTDLPITANIRLDDDAHLQKYMKEYEVKKLIQQRAQRERELRQLRMETRKFYGISLARPTGSPMMFGGMYAPNWSGGFHYGYGLRGQYPRQQLFFEYR